MLTWSLPVHPLETKFCRPHIEPLVSVPHLPMPSVPLPVFPILVTALPPTQLLKPETCSHPQLLPAALHPHPVTQSWKYTLAHSIHTRPGTDMAGITEAAQQCEENLGSRTTPLTSEPWRGYQLAG